MFLGIICCRADFHVLFICCTRLTPRSPIAIFYPNHVAAALPVATECRPSGSGMKQIEDYIGILYGELHLSTKLNSLLYIVLSKCYLKGSKRNFYNTKYLP